MLNAGTRDLVDATGRTLPPVEAPDADKLRVYGDMTFLAFRSDRHRAMSLATLRHYLEPPIELGQFRIFRFDDVPRGMYTWAWLDQKAERKLIRGKPLDPQDWRSGDALWIVDLIAPYRGLTTSMVRFIMSPGNFTDDEFYFRRVRGADETRRIVHISFKRDRLSKVHDTDSFLAMRRAG